MPEKLPAGVEISISRRSLPVDYQMPDEKPRRGQARRQKGRTA